jgi:ribonucleotide monophosphatase NagD (HAD superfamily)
LDSKAIAGAHGGLLVDLDGTVYRGSTAITGAADALKKIGRRAVFLTNNASKSQPTCGPWD